jgi:hypothetical protein
MANYRRYSIDGIGKIIGLESLYQAAMHATCAGRARARCGYVQALIRRELRAD